MRIKFLEDIFKNFLVDYVDDVIFDLMDDSDEELVKAVRLKMEEEYLPTVIDKVTGEYYRLLSGDEDDELEEYEVSEDVYSFVLACVKELGTDLGEDLDEDIITWLTHSVGMFLEEDLETHVAGYVNELLEEVDEAKIIATTIKAGKRLKKKVDTTKRTKRLSALRRRAMKRMTRRKKPGQIRKWRKSMKRRGTMLSQGIRDRARKAIRKHKEKSRDLLGSMRKLGQAKEGMELGIYMVAQESFTLYDINGRIVDIELGSFLEMYDYDKSHTVMDIYYDGIVVDEDIIFETSQIGSYLEQNLLESVDYEGLYYNDIVSELDDLVINELVGGYCSE